MTDAYEAKWLLAFLNDDPTGLDLTQRAADLGCAPTVEAVTEALRVIAGHCGRGPCWKEGGHDGPCEPGGRDDPRRTTEKDAAFDAVHLTLCKAGLIDPEAHSDALVDSLVSAATTPSGRPSSERDGACICDYNPSTTDGPDECCPFHGRPYVYWIERGDALMERIQRVEALAAEWATHTEDPRAWAAVRIMDATGTSVTPPAIGGAS